MAVRSLTCHQEPSLIILRYADYFVLVSYKFNVIE